MDRMPRLFNSAAASRSIRCLSTSFSTNVEMSRSSCTPLISIRDPPLIETFKSSRIVPIPRITFLVARRREQKARATTRACSWVSESSLYQLPRRILLQEDGLYVHSLPARLELSVQGDECGSLESRAVRTIDHDLLHEVDFARTLRFE